MCSFFLFFKQKTAYEMRISDWSSDVCSSDLNYLIYIRIGFQYTCKGFFGDKGNMAVGQLLFNAAHHRGGEHDIADRAKAQDEDTGSHKIGRASCRERVCQYV